MQERETPPFGLPVVVFLAGVLALGAWQRPAPMDSSRPTDPPAKKDSHGEGSSVSARLWEDPLLPMTAAADSRLRPTPAKEFAREIAESATIALIQTREVLFLPVFLRGDDYQESLETRLQTRYAVLSALQVAGYAPEDGERMGAVGVSWNAGHTEPAPPASIDSLASQVMVAGLLPAPPAASESAIASSQAPRKPDLVIPFERFSQAQLRWDDTVRSRFSRIYVLWLNEAALSPNPLSKLCDVVGALGPDPERGGPKGLKKVVLGPRSSTTLLAMLEDCPGSDVCRAKELDGTWIRSPWVTASADVIEQHMKTGRRFKLEAEDWLHRGHGPWFMRGTTPDDVLMEAISEELQTRGSLSKPHSGGSAHVVLVSEWDTLYGRALPKTFQSLQARLRPHRTSPPYCRDSEPEVTFHYRTYMRGIDGLLPGESPRKPEPGPIRTDPILGKGQVDYLRRMSDELHDSTERLIRGDLGRKPPKVEAIGILGSDVYDKLLLLRALRPRFSSAVFFTTDLDVRLLDPKEHEWCRNLVVVSGFGLHNDTELESGAGVTRFRNSYQTSTYECALWALDAQIPRAPSQGKNDQRKIHTGEWKPTTARIFEVSRTGAHPLAVYDAERPVGDRLLVPAQNDGPSQLTPIFLGVGGAVLLLALALLLFVERWWNPDLDWLWNLLGLFKRPIFLGIVGTTAMIGLAVWDQGTPAGEPFLLLEGISTWPTTIIRAVAVITALLFIRLAGTQLKLSNRAIRAQFQLERGDATGSTQFGRHVCGIAGVACLVAGAALLSQDADAFLSAMLAGLGVFAVGAYPVDRWVRLDLGPSLSLRRAWGRYIQWCSRSGMITRASYYSAIFLAAAGPMFFIFEQPMHPTRGWLNTTAYMVALVCAVVLQTVLIFLVVDATRSSILFINYLHQRLESPKPAGPTSEGTRRLPTSSAFFARLGLSDQHRKWFVFSALLGVLGMSLWMWAPSDRAQWRALPCLPAVLLALSYAWALRNEDLARKAAAELPQSAAQDNEETKVRWVLDQAVVGHAYAALAIQMVAKHSRVVGNLIYLPCVILCLMLVARYPGFDNYDWPPALVVILLLSFGLAIACGLALRVAAEQMRGSFLGQLESQLTEGQANNKEAKELEPIERARKVIEAERGGAFGPFAQNPVLRALLIPLGGLGSIGALEAILSQLLQR